MTAQEHEPLPEGEEAPPPGVPLMAIIRWLLVALMAIVAAASLLHYAGGFATGGAPTAAVQYYCPMHPSVVQNQPGECPICSMTLVPRTVESAGGGTPPAEPAAVGTAEVPGLAPIQLTPQRIQLIGMRTARVAFQQLAPTLRAVAVVAANEEGRAQVHTRFAGWVEELQANQTGQHVKRGEVLATIYSPDLLTTQHELLNAHRWSGTHEEGAADEHAGPDLIEGARRRLELLGIAHEDIVRLERGGEPLRAIPIRAPVDGYVIEKRAVRGLYVEPGTTLFEIADLSTVWALADIPESDVARVQVGQAADLELTAYPGEPFRGRVEFIAPTIDPATRTLRLRLVFANPSLRLRPGMYGDVTITLPSATGLFVPRDAIVDTGAHRYVFLARDGGRFEPRAIELGVRAGDDVEVTRGLVEGDTVVTTANFLLDSESRLRAAIAGPAGAGAPAAVSECDRDFDRVRFPEKYEQCRACELQHRGMGTMETDCKRAIPQPWR